MSPCQHGTPSQFIPQPRHPPLAGTAASREEMLLAYQQTWADDVDADVSVRYPKGDSEEKLQDLAGGPRQRP